jgi:hypothetical protein
VFAVIAMRRKIGYSKDDFLVVSVCSQVVYSRFSSRCVSPIMPSSPALPCSALLSGIDTFFLLFLNFFGRLECVGHSFTYVAHFVFLRDVWILSQRAAVAGRRANNLATHL